MKVIGLDEKVYNWNLNGYLTQRDNCSSYHRKARKILNEEFPMISILEEVAIPGCGSHKLFADFFLPSKKIMVEVQGEQHYAYNDFFHGNSLGNKMDFYRAQKRDKDKKNWCELNNIVLIELSFKESEIVWRNKIRLRGEPNAAMG